MHGEKDGIAQTSLEIRCGLIKFNGERLLIDNLEPFHTPCSFLVALDGLEEIGREHAVLYSVVPRIDVVLGTHRGAIGEHRILLERDLVRHVIGLLDALCLVVVHLTVLIEVHESRVDEVDERCARHIAGICRDERLLGFGGVSTDEINIRRITRSVSSACSQASCCDDSGEARADFCPFHEFSLGVSYA